MPLSDDDCAHCGCWEDGGLCCDCGTENYDYDGDSDNDDLDDVDPYSDIVTARDKLTFDDDGSSEESEDGL